MCVLTVCVCKPKEDDNDNHKERPGGRGLGRIIISFHDDPRKETTNNPKQKHGRRAQAAVARALLGPRTRRARVFI